MDAKLTLEKDLRQKEAVKGHQQQLTSKPGHRPEMLEALALARKPERHKDGRGKGQIVFSKTSHKGGLETKSLYKENLDTLLVPAKDVECISVIGKVTTRRSVSLKLASTDEVKVDMAFLGAVGDGSPTQWRISVQVGDKLLC